MPVDGQGFPFDYNGLTDGSGRLDRRLARQCLKSRQFRKISEWEDAAGMAVGKGDVQAIVADRRRLHDFDSECRGSVCAVHPRAAADCATTLHAQSISLESKSASIEKDYVQDAPVVTD